MSNPWDDLPDAEEISSAATFKNPWDDLPDAETSVSSFVPFTNQTQSALAESIRTTPTAVLFPSTIGVRHDEERNFIERISDNFKRGRYEHKMDQRIGLAIMTNDEDQWDQLYNERMAYIEAVQKDPIAADNIVEKAVLDASRMLYGMGQSAVTKFAGAAAGAGVALALGQAGPQAAAPEEIITIPIAAYRGWRTGGLAGGMAPWYIQGVGQQYAAMREKGFSHDSARAAALVSAAPYAAVEFINEFIPLKRLFPGIAARLQPMLSKTVGQVATRVATQYGKNVFGESIEEGVQQVIQDTTELITAEIDGKEDLKPEMKDILKNAVGATLAAIGPSAVLAIPGGAYNVRAERQGMRFQNAMEKLGYDDKTIRDLAYNLGMGDPVIERAKKSATAFNTLTELNAPREVFKIAAKTGMPDEIADAYKTGFNKGGINEAMRMVQERQKVLETITGGKDAEETGTETKAAMQKEGAGEGEMQRVRLRDTEKDRMGTVNAKAPVVQPQPGEVTPEIQPTAAPVQPTEGAEVESGTPPPTTVVTPEAKEPAPVAQFQWLPRPKLRVGIGKEAKTITESVGAQVKIAPINEFMFERYIKPNKGTTALSLETYKERFPENTHIQLTKPAGQDWRMTGLGSYESLSAPMESNSAAKKVADLEATEAKAWGITPIRQFKKGQREAYLKLLERVPRTDMNIVRVDTPLEKLREQVTGDNPATTPTAWQDVDGTYIGIPQNQKRWGKPGVLLGELVENENAIRLFGWSEDRWYPITTQGKYTPAERRKFAKQFSRPHPQAAKQPKEIAAEEEVKVGVSEPTGEERMPLDMGKKQKNIDTHITPADKKTYWHRLVGRFIDLIAMFQGHKKDMAPVVIKAANETKNRVLKDGTVIPYSGWTPAQVAQITKINELFGGGGSWGLFNAMTKFFNVNHIVIRELNQLRLDMIRYMHEQGENFKRDVDKVDPSNNLSVHKIVENLWFEEPAIASGGGIVGRIGPVLEARAYDKKTLTDEQLMLLQILHDLMPRVDMGFQEAIDKVANQSKNLRSMAKQFYKNRENAKIEYKKGDSYDPVETPIEEGNHILSIMDPPYVFTTGYDEGKKTLVGTDIYAKTRDLVKRVIAGNNNLIYTDSAWWIPEFGKYADSGEKQVTQSEKQRAKPILADIYNSFEKIAPVEKLIGGHRYEVLGLHNALRTPEEEAAIPAAEAKPATPVKTEAEIEAELPYKVGSKVLFRITRKSTKNKYGTVKQIVVNMDGSVTTMVQQDKTKKIIELRSDKGSTIIPSSGIEKALYTKSTIKAELEEYNPEQKKKIKADASEFDRLIKLVPEFYDWEAVQNEKIYENQELANAREAAFTAIGIEKNEDEVKSPVARSEALPQLIDWMKGQPELWNRLVEMKLTPKTEKEFTAEERAAFERRIRGQPETALSKRLPPPDPKPTETGREPIIAEREAGAGAPSPEQLITEHTELANEIAGTYTIPGMTADEIRSEAQAALIRAANRRPDARDFVGFARSAIRNALNNLSRSQKRKPAPVSLQAPAGREEEGEGLTLEERIAGPGLTPDQEATRNQIIRDMREMVKKLSGKNRIIADMVLLRRPRDEVATELGMSGAAVSERKVALFRKLRKQLEAKGYDAAEIADAKMQPGQRGDMTVMSKANRMAAPSIYQTSITPEQDAAYMAAVDKGDTATAQRMVDEAAKKAGYTVEGWHGTHAEKFNVFKVGEDGLIHVGSSKAQAAANMNRKEEEAGVTEEATRRIEHVYLQMKYPKRVMDAGGVDEWIRTANQAMKEDYDSLVYANEWEIPEDLEPGSEFPDSYAIFDATQIKSAEPITRDDAGNVIPLSQRFQTAEPDIRFAKRREAAGAVTRSQAQSRVNNWIKDKTNLPEIVVIGTVDDIADYDFDGNFLRMMREEQPRGFFNTSRNQIFVIADALQTPDEALEVVLHEAIGHYGIMQVLGTDYQKAMVNLSKEIPEADLRAFAEAYKGQLPDKELADPLTSDANLVTIAAEYIASKAETEPSLWQKFINIVRKALSKIMPASYVNRLLKQGKIEQLIQTSREFTERGAMPAEAVIPAETMLAKEQPLNVETAKQLWGIGKKMHVTPEEEDLLDAIKNNDPNLPYMVLDYWQTIGFAEIATNQYPAITKAFEDAVKRIPIKSLPGKTIYRFQGYKTASARSEYLKNYKPGSIIEIDRPVNAFSIDTAYGLDMAKTFGGNYLIEFKINSPMYGKSIDVLRGSPVGSEMLYSRGDKFEVVSITPDEQRNNIIVTLKEAPEQTAEQKILFSKQKKERERKFMPVTAETEEAKNAQKLFLEEAMRFNPKVIPEYTMQTIAEKEIAEEGIDNAVANVMRVMSFGDPKSDKAVMRARVIMSHPEVYKKANGTDVDKDTFTVLSNLALELVSKTARGLRYARNDLKTNEQRQALINQMMNSAPSRYSKKWEELTQEQRNDAMQQIKITRQRAIEALDRIGIKDYTNIDWSVWSNNRDFQRIIEQIAQNKATFGDKMYEFWRNAILSGLQTNIVNMTSNFFFGSWELFMQRPIEALFNQLVFKGKLPGAATFESLWETYKLIFPSIAAANLSFRNAFINEIGDYTKLETNGSTSLRGKFGWWVRRPQATMIAMDEWFKTIYVRALSADYAIRRANATKLVGKDRDAYINWSMEEGNPAWKEALEEGKRMLFQAPAGPISSQLIAARHIPGPIGWVAKFVVPFVVTPTNIIKIGLQKSPLGIFRMGWEGMKNITGDPKGRYIGERGQANLLTDTAEQFTSWAIAGMLYALTAPPDPDDPENRDRWPLLTGSLKGHYAEKTFQRFAIPPQSFRIGDRWFSYSRIEPFATALTLIIDGLDTFRSVKGGKPLSRSDGLKLLSLVRDKTYLQGLGDIMRGIENPEDWAYMFKNFGSSWMPNILRQAINATDPNVRDIRVRSKGMEWLAEATFKRGFQSAIPIAPLQPIPRYDHWGNPISKNVWNDSNKVSLSDIAWRIVVPLRAQTTKNVTNIDRMIWNYNRAQIEPDKTWFPGTPRPEITIRGQKIKMTDRQFETFLKMRGKLALAMAQRQPWNFNTPTDRDIQRLEKIFSNASTIARKQIMQEIMREYIQKLSAAKK